MPACTRCQLARPPLKIDPPLDWPAGTIRCGHRIGPDDMAAIHHRVNPIVSRWIVETNEAPFPHIVPAEQPAMCPVRVPPHAATPSATP